jgi:hypothetical protein
MAFPPRAELFQGLEWLIAGFLLLFLCWLPFAVVSIAKTLPGL